MLHTLSPALIRQILDEAKRILHEIGVEVRGDALRERLLKAGLTQDAASGRVLFPPEVVEAAIASTPKTFTLYDRAGQPHAELGGDAVHFVPGSSGLKILDRPTGRARPATTADFVEYIWLADGLPHIAYLATAFSTHDIPPEISDAWRLYLTLTHSRKPVVTGAFTAEGVPRMAEMMAVFREGRDDLAARPMSIFTITPSAMFRYSEDSCQNLLDCVEWGIPIEIVPVTLLGLAAPVTPVGAVVFHVADVLAGLTMAQVVRPGAPALFGGAPAAFHMQHTTAPMAAIEALKLDTAYVEVAKALGLPTQAYMALSDAKTLDAQAGAETFGGALLAALAGVNSVSGPGMLDYVLTFSLEKLVFDNEMCGQALHFVRETTVTEDVPTVALARQLLDEQHLLTAEHTRRHWPAALHLPASVVERLTREEWMKQGKPDLMQRAQAEVDRRLAAYSPIETEPRAEAELRRILRAGGHENTPLPAIPRPPAKPPAPRAPRPRRRKRRG